MLAISKAADLNKFVQGGQLYWSSPLSYLKQSKMSFQVLYFIDKKVRQRTQGFQRRKTTRENNEIYVLLL
jgi:hypothetical protein